MKSGEPSTRAARSAGGAASIDALVVGIQKVKEIFADLT